MAPTTRSKVPKGDSRSSSECDNSMTGRFVSMWQTVVERDCLLDGAQLKRLADHKYSATDSSYLDALCMQKFWNKVVLLYPLWLAPNLITLIGLLVNIISVLILSYYSPDGKEMAPRWTYALCALCLFIYQTLDATDGKQARRTGTASPIGELFDHGCDSLSQVFVSVMVCLSMLLGRHEGAIVGVTTAAIIVFYMAHWSTYCTGTLKFEKFDVTEAQMCVIGITLSTAVFGPQFWLVHIPVIGMPLNLALIMSVALGGFVQGLSYLMTILNGGVGKNGSTVAGTSVLFPILPLVLFTTAHLMIYFKCDTNAYSDSIVTFCCCYGFVSAKICNRLIIAHMSRSPLDWWDSIYLGPIAMIMNQYFNNMLPELFILYACTLYSLANLLVHAVYCINQLCAYLNIECFRIKAVKQ